MQLAMLIRTSCFQIKSVDNFVASVNAALKRNEEMARLANIVSRLETYDVVESRDEELDKFIKMYSNFDIVNAPIPGCSKDVFRTLLREGDLKLRDAVTSKVIDFAIYSFYFHTIFY